eukprot:COSAG04_NODE_15_length_40535_cov_25.319888_6_plen_79_part_00
MASAAASLIAAMAADVAGRWAELKQASSDGSADTEPVLLEAERAMKSNRRKLTEATKAFKEGAHAAALLSSAAPPRAL